MASMPVLAYLYSYLYSFGYGQYFMLPDGLVSFSLPSLFSTLTALLASSLALLYLLTNITTKPKVKPDESYVAIENIFLLIALLMATIILDAPKRLVITIGVITGYFIAHHILMPYVVHSSAGNLRKRINAHITKAMANELTAMDFVFNLPLKRYSSYLILVAGSLVLTFCLGFRAAQTQEQFYVEKQDTSWVAVRFLDDKAVMVHRKATQLTGEFKVIPITDGVNSLVFQPLKTGVLKPAK